ncbi:MAG: hypothetical protein LBR74_01890 [Eubacterium sp.]|jgi:carbamoyl-phosphate synthase small subunit|nr:hypothetical protein [Eubacterium sp.]
MNLLDYKKAALILENGMVFDGKAFGFEGEAEGEIIFSTSMTGYQQTLTDPCNEGKIITATFPLIGNYGTNSEDYRSLNYKAAGFVVREYCAEPSNFRCEWTLDSFMKREKIVGIYDVDTRKLTRIIRDNGIMKAKIINT